jgi:hypothetical protein
MELKIKKIEKGSNFIHVVTELDGQIYEGILFSKGEKNEKATQDMVSDGREDGKI